MLAENAMKLLANPLRVAILSWLKQPDVTFAAYSQLYPYEQYGVCASLIQDKAGLSQPATSLCLKSLHELGVVEAQKVGKWTYYRRNNARIQEIVDSITEQLQQL
ncbi:ArsR/SmtB family transcription factor [Rosenbergiella australiborealis]|uniref:Helix-turn-helix transcriptional regulator n=1 Tax=Rosenbergiella australiborealis TaxID=1544696 RepID=A0ABS5T4E8_9GAMM|nr:helix-turn-helix transcriptional regulator [Rosenbergiella australiborealis]MBT0727196.1 helix-turn-helix transcriptional regulator [Rosenbergiella australiborealis]